MPNAITRTRRILPAALAAVLAGSVIAAPSPTFAPVTGNILFAEGRFAKAARAYERAVAQNPRSAGALAGLARMLLYQHREDEAARLARRALELAPSDSLATQVLRTVEARRRAFGGDVFRVDPSVSADADFVITDPLPVIRARITGRAGALLIDTGAPDIAVNRSVAIDLGLPLADGGLGMFAGGEQAKVERTVVPELTIGGLRISNVPAAINPAELQLPGIRADGVVGAGLLMHFLATIDYCSGKLILAPRSGSMAFERRASKSGANIVPMWLVGDHFIFAEAKLNGVDGLFNIDTGLAGGGLVATRATVEAGHIRLQDRTLSGQGGGGSVRFVPFRASASLGSLRLKDVPGVYTPDGDPYRIFPFKVAGALSHSFFRHSRLTLDFVAMKLVTQTC